MTEPQASEEAIKLAAEALDASVHPPGCPSNCHQLRVALVIDRVSRERTRLALERAAKAVCWACALPEQWTSAADVTDHRGKSVLAHKPKKGTKHPPLLQWTKCDAVAIRALMPGGK